MLHTNRVNSKHVKIVEKHLIIKINKYDTIFGNNFLS